MLSTAWAILRSSAFRRVAAMSGAFGCATLLLFGFIYWQAAAYQTQRIEIWVEDQLANVARLAPQQMQWTVNAGIARDLLRIGFAGLFEEAGGLVAGNLPRLPQMVTLDGRAHRLETQQLDPALPDNEPVIVAAERLPGGRVLVIARADRQLSELRSVVTRALQLGVVPALLLALAIGALIGHRTNQRLLVVRRVLDRVRRGKLTERLPVHGDGSDFDQVARGVNHMLGEVERLLTELHDVGNNIAHDLRTPLSRVRTQLERARRVATTHEELAAAVDRAVLGLDQASATITALLRIAEIEHSQRGASFEPVALADVAQDALELYAPIAEAKGVGVGLRAREPVHALADRELLFEAVANLLDNAIKFTPPGGEVSVRVSRHAGGGEIAVSDTGPGIPPDQRGQVFSRFVRLDKSRNTAGNGLGLSLVQAILRLHGFTAAMDEAPGGGCVVHILCPVAASVSAPACDAQAWAAPSTAARHAAPGPAGARPAG